MPITAILAHDSLGCLCDKDGKIPWDLPEERAWFRRVTMGHPVIMGRRTFETLKKPLDGRLNIVLSRNGGYSAFERFHDPTTQVTTADGLWWALSAHRHNSPFIIGGYEIYQQAFDQNLVDRLLVSFVRSSAPGVERPDWYDQQLWHRDLIRQKFLSIPELPAGQSWAQHLVYASQHFSVHAYSKNWVSWENGLLKED